MKDLYQVLGNESEIPDNAVWGVSPSEPGVQVGGPILVPVVGSGYLVDAWLEFRRLEKIGVMQPAIEQGMKVKLLLDALSGWTDEEDEST